MSTVKADFFTWRNGEATAQVSPTITGEQLVRGVAKTWCSYNTITTTTLRASFNTSSLTDNGTGDTTVAFTNAFIDTNYSFAGTIQCVASGAATLTHSQTGTASPTTNTIRLITLTTGGNLGDAPIINVTVDR